jgi:hypothetical protein
MHAQRQGDPISQYRLTPSNARLFADVTRTSPDMLKKLISFMKTALAVYQ